MDDRIIDKADDQELQKLGTEFEYVEFRNCTFTNISGIEFTNCTFTSCNLSNASVANTKMQDLKFNDCKLIGINFSDTNSFGFSAQFNNCMMDYTNFTRRKLIKCSFVNCKLEGSNFSATDLSKSKIERCNLHYAIFSDTNISGLDFTSNYNFTIDPSKNKVKKTKFLSSNLAGLLSHFDITIINN